MTAATRQQQLAAIFKSATVIPVLTIERLEDAVPLARALVGGWSAWQAAALPTQPKSQLAVG